MLKNQIFGQRLVHNMREKCKNTRGIRICNRFLTAKFTHGVIHVFRLFQAKQKGGQKLASSVNYDPTPEKKSENSPHIVGEILAKYERTTLKNGCVTLLEKFFDKFCCPFFGPNFGLFSDKRGVINKKPVKSPATYLHNNVRDRKHRGKRNFSKEWS